MGGTNATLSVVILTKNEEQHIAACIESVSSVGEVIVVDSGSTDRTQELAAKAGARVVERALTTYDDQRNYANTIATCDWILHLDADERATPALLAEIKSVTESGSADGYRVPTSNIIFGEPLRHGGWYPSYHVRLQRRGRVTWKGNVHELAYVEGALGTLKEPIVHNSFATVSRFIVKLDRYSAMEAQRASGSVLSYAVRAVFEPPMYFVYKYFVQAGFLDGWRGLVIALLMAFYRCSGYLKAIERLAGKAG
jgi:glycosyltransferase involved in cell wall biosynthesis